MRRTVSTEIFIRHRLHHRSCSDSDSVSEETTHGYDQIMLSHYVTMTLVQNNATHLLLLAYPHVTVVTEAELRSEAVSVTNALTSF